MAFGWKVGRIGIVMAGARVGLWPAFQAPQIQLPLGTGIEIDRRPLSML